MPKLNHAVPKYRKHKASGQAVVTINGKDHYLGPHGTAVSRHEYDRLVSEYLALGRRSPRAEPKHQTTVNEILAAFWRHAQTWYVKDGKPTNELDAYRVLMRDVRRLYGHTLATSFGPLALKAVRQCWIDQGQSRPTVNKNTGRLKRIFKWAVAEELVPASVHQSLATVDGLRKGRCECVEPEPVLPVELEVVETTIPFLPAVTRDMVRFQLLTGARPGEVCKLTPGAIDRSGDVWEAGITGHKTEHHGRSRTIYIGPEAQAVLRPYLLRASDSVCFSMAESLEQRRQLRNDARTTPASCGNRRGRRSNSDRRRKSVKRRKPQNEFDASSYRHAIHAACDDAFPAPEPLGRQEGESNAARLRRLNEKQRTELNEWQRARRWHPNQLRHTRATDIRKQFGLEAAQVILGHAAADITQIYAERDAEKAREVAKAIG